MDHRHRHARGTTEVVLGAARYLLGADAGIGNRAIDLVAHDASGEMLAGELPALKVESIPVAVVGWKPEYANVAVILEPPELPVVGDVAPDEIAPLRVPCRALLGPLNPQPSP